MKNRLKNWLIGVAVRFLVKPMESGRFRKYIVSHSWGNNETNDEFRSGNAFIIPNHYHHGVDGFLQMFLEARKSFPTLRIEDCEMSHVVDSGWCKRMPVLRFSCKPDLTIAGWHAVENHIGDCVML